jgi:hypothetical protein
MTARQVNFSSERGNTDINNGRKLSEFPGPLHTECPHCRFFIGVPHAVDQQVQGEYGPIYDLSDRLNNVAKWYLIARRAVTPANYHRHPDIPLYLNPFIDLWPSFR